MYIVREWENAEGVSHHFRQSNPSSTSIFELLGKLIRQAAVSGLAGAHQCSLPACAPADHKCKENRRSLCCGTKRTITPIPRVTSALCVGL